MSRVRAVFNGMTYAALTILGAYAVLVIALTVFQRNLMYHPNQTVPTPASFGVPEMSMERIPTPDGYPLLAWWREPISPEKPVLLYLHGNAGHLGDRAEKVQPYLDAGYGVMLITYRYNAGTGGTPGQEALMIDARTAVDALNARGYEPDDIVLYGESLGTGLAVRLAADGGYRALVLEAPYSSVADVAASMYWYIPARLLLRDHYDSTSVVDQIDTRLLIVHGGQDRVIAPRFAKKLFQAAPDPKEMIMIDEAHHTNLYDFGMGKLAVEFIEKSAP